MRSFILGCVTMNRLAYLRHQLRDNVWALCSASLLFILSTSCHKSAPTQPPVGIDTTSHNFTWQNILLGDAGANSDIKDVAVINDSLVYIVGEIHLQDSSGQVDPNPFNLGRWNGTRWDILRIQFYTICGQSRLTPYPTSSVFGFGPTDLWVAMDGSQVAHWNGAVQTGTTCGLTFVINDLWGTSPSSVYAVGLGGNITHFDGSSWQNAQSGTTVNLLDIRGTIDGKVIWACGYSTDLSQSVLLRSDGTQWSTIWSTQSGALTPPYGQLVISVWAGDSYLYVAADDGIYRSPTSGNGAAQRILAIPTAPLRIRGSGENNIAVACADGSIWHYNGATWKQVATGAPSMPLYSIAVSTNLIVAVGFDATGIDLKGRVVIGRRE